MRLCQTGARGRQLPADHQMYRHRAKALSSLNIIHVAAPHLEALNLAIGETINFSTREDDHAILIYKLEPTTGMLRTRAYIGQHQELYCSAMGKVYMAFGQPEYVEQYWKSHREYIKPLTRYTIDKLDVMQQELKEIRAQKWAKDREENELGVSCWRFRCSTFMAGCLMPCLFRYPLHALNY